LKIILLAPLFLLAADAYPYYNESVKVQLENIKKVTQERRQKKNKILARARELSVLSQTKQQDRRKLNSRKPLISDIKLIKTSHQWVKPVQVKFYVDYLIKYDGYQKEQLDKVDAFLKSWANKGYYLQHSEDNTGSIDMNTTLVQYRVRLASK